jgi:peptide/nickel transport system permease protein
VINYILKRILIFIPNGLLISLALFFISTITPGDPAEMLLNHADKKPSFSSYSDASYQAVVHELGLDLPLFYFSVKSKPLPDTLYKVTHRRHREALLKLALQYGSWRNVSNYYLSVRHLQGLADSKKMPALSLQLEQLLLLNKEGMAEEMIHALAAGYLLPDFDFTTIEASFKKMLKEKDGDVKYIPVVYWHGLPNQYHHWLIHCLSGNFGYSYKDRQPVSGKIYPAFMQTLLVSLLALFISFGIGILLGVYTSTHVNSFKTKCINTLLLSFYSLPTIWVASLLVLFFCGGDYWAWFPAPGSIKRSANGIVGVAKQLQVYVLPLFCWVYPSLAYIHKQMQSAMNTALGQPYIQTARAKGMKQKDVVWKHAFRNSLLPMVTLIGYLLPMILAGSFVIETIFQLSGMGKLTVDLWQEIILLFFLSPFCYPSSPY